MLTPSTRTATLIALISFPASVLAQASGQNAQRDQNTQHDAAPAQQAPVCGQPVTVQQQPDSAASVAGKEKKEEIPIAKEVGASAAGTAGQIGGAAVAGPIGAAVGGVVASKVGEAVGSLVKKKKKKSAQANTQDRQQQQTAEGQPGSAPAGPQVVCVTPGEPPQPQN